MTGKKFRCPTICIRQYIQRLVGGTNNIEQERSINALYLGRAEDGSGHILFNLDTEVVVLVNRVVLIPNPQTVIDRVNEIGISKKQPEGVQFTNRDNRVSINDLDLNLDDNNNDNSNTFDDSFEHNKEYQEEFDRKEKDNDLATNKVQEDHFPLPFQQHQAATLLTDKPSKLRSTKVRSMEGLKKKTK